MVSSENKRELDRKRNEWRKYHRTLNGKVILYPEKEPEHISARGSKLYNWFWKKILLEIEIQSIPGIISAIQDQIKAEKDTTKIRMFRTMIGMAEDAYQLKLLEDVKDYDSELLLGKKPVYDSESGIIYKNGNIYTTDYSQDEQEILLRDVEGIVIDVLSSDDKEKKSLPNALRTEIYRDWNYMEKI